MYCALGRDIHCIIYGDLDVYALMELSSVNHYRDNIVKQIEAYITLVKLKKNSVSKTFK